MYDENKNSIIEELAMIAHEFRRPIDTISKSAELVNRANFVGRLEEEKILEIMDGIINSCHRLNLLTSQIMSLAQVESGTSKIMVEKLNVVDFINDLQKLITFHENNKNIKFTFNVKLKNPYAICDFKKLERILLNLISNAVKYSRKSNRRITIKVSDEDDILNFSIKDRGIGIPHSEHDKIFKKFYRVEGFNTRLTEGCGLGLATVKRFTETLGGNVNVISTEGKGSEFIVRIPRTQENGHSPTKVVEVARSYQLYKSSIDEIFADI